MEYDLIENKSKIYYNGSKWMSKSCGEFEIIGKIDRYYLKSNGVKDYKYYLIKFNDRTTVGISSGAILKGTVKNPNFPILYGKGYLGIGKWKSSIKGKSTREYQLWTGILGRCYREDSYNITYKDCEVDEEWFSFQVFAEDLKDLHGYREWKNSKVPRLWQLDKDIKVKGNKIYSKENCKLVLRKDNMARNNKTQRLTGLTYVAMRISDGYTEEFINQSEFADEYNLSEAHISHCVNNKRNTHKGWKFEIKEEINE